MIRGLLVGAVRQAAGARLTCCRAVSTASRKPQSALLTQLSSQHAHFSVGTPAAEIAQTRVEHSVEGADPDKAFAVIAFSGKQYKCVEDDLLICDRQDNLDIGDEIVIDDVLLIGTGTETIVGRPLVQSASVRAVCEQHPKDKKTIIFKKKRRKGYRRKNGFRRQLTVLRVLEINKGASS